MKKAGLLGFISSPPPNSYTLPKKRARGSEPSVTSLIRAKQSLHIRKHADYKPLSVPVPPAPISRAAEKKPTRVTLKLVQKGRRRSPSLKCVILVLSCTDVEGAAVVRRETLPLSAERSPASLLSPPLHPFARCFGNILILNTPGMLIKLSLSFFLPINQSKQTRGGRRKKKDFFYPPLQTIKSMCPGASGASKPTRNYAPPPAFPFRTKSGFDDG